MPCVLIRIPKKCLFCLLHFFVLSVKGPTRGVNPDEGLVTGKKERKVPTSAKSYPKELGPLKIQN
jgi:hypothetical protein